MEVPTMKVKTTRFGEIEIDQARVIKFPEGILGFPDNKEFILLQTNTEGNFFWLQSGNRPELAFVVCDPLLFVPDYQVPVKADDLALVGLDSMENSQVLIIVNKVDRSLTGNLQGPLVINALNCQAKQMVLSEKKYSTRHPLLELRESDEVQVSQTA
jgi:flagellar assembly factor FliW